MSITVAPRPGWDLLRLLALMDMFTVIGLVLICLIDVGLSDGNPSVFPLMVVVARLALCADEPAPAVESLP